MPDYDWQYAIKELDYQAVHEPTAAAVDNVFTLDDATHVIPDKFVSPQFQWLPTDFVIDHSGKVDIRSYINNLHPERHRRLYPLLARIFESALPLFERVLARLHDPVPLRIKVSPTTWYDHLERPPTPDHANIDWLMELYVTREPYVPPPKVEHKARAPFSLRGRTLKVVTKLANIHLTPNEQFYLSNLSWRVAGMANEAIVATALYFYDLDNFSDAKIQFRNTVQCSPNFAPIAQGNDYEYELSEYPARTLREFSMYARLEAVRDLHNWAREWNDPATRAELVAHIFKRPRYYEVQEDRQYLIDELDYQAVHEPTAAAVDNVFSSDDAMPDDVRTTLIKQVARLLENVPSRTQNWDPKSDHQVLHLVHQLLHPLIYEKTLVLPKDEDVAPITLDNWQMHLGGGAPIDATPRAVLALAWIPDEFVSLDYQNLPADFAIDDDGKVAICSYISGLHPDWHRPLYPLLARIFENALPLFERAVARCDHPVPLRIRAHQMSWYDHIGEPTFPTAWQGDIPIYDVGREEWLAEREPDIPSPSFVPHTPMLLPLCGGTVKVATQLTNIHLIPGEPSYPVPV
ncbi:hypothetical protein GGF32_005136 [Allomyces javanicus]|nr:hypothetical protein GGF32_005136 [Allomyces javanicus]